jgi:hypothetical protein
MLYQVEHTLILSFLSRNLVNTTSWPANKEPYLMIKPHVGLFARTHHTYTCWRLLCSEESSASIEHPCAFILHRVLRLLLLDDDPVAASELNGHRHLGQRLAELLHALNVHLHDLPLHLSVLRVHADSPQRRREHVPLVLLAAAGRRQSFRRVAGHGRRGFVRVGGRGFSTALAGEEEAAALSSSLAVVVVEAFLLPSDAAAFSPSPRGLLLISMMASGGRSSPSCKKGGYCTAMPRLSSTTFRSGNSTLA